MKVAMVTRDYPPTTGGVPTVVENLVKELRLKGVEVDVFEGHTNYRTLTLPLHGALRSSNYDLIHVQSGPFGALVTRHPMVLTLHSPIVEEAKYYELKKRLTVPFAYILEKQSLRNADVVIADSRFVMRALVDDYGIDPNRLALIPLGVDSEKFNPRKKTPSAIPRVLICSRLDQRKNISEALSALSSLKGIPYELTIVGDGPERGKLERIARESGLSAAFAGRVDQETLHDVFSRSHIFISPSLSEGFGLSVLEAMASGCAVVVSDIPCHAELVSHERDGVVYSNKGELVSWLEKLLRDPALVNGLGNAARKKTLPLSWGEVAKETVALYERLLGKR